MKYAYLFFLCIATVSFAVEPGQPAVRINNNGTFTWRPDGIRNSDNRDVGHFAKRGDLHESQGWHEYVPFAPPSGSVVIAGTRTLNTNVTPYAETWGTETLAERDARIEAEEYEAALIRMGKFKFPVLPDHPTTNEAAFYAPTGGRYLLLESNVYTQWKLRMDDGVSSLDSAHKVGNREIEVKRDFFIDTREEVYVEKGTGPGGRDSGPIRRVIPVKEFPARAAVKRKSPSVRDPAPSSNPLKTQSNTFR